MSSATWSCSIDCPAPGRGNKAKLECKQLADKANRAAGVIEQLDAAEIDVALAAAA
jgi:hypothetical protein